MTGRNPDTTRTDFSNAARAPANTPRARLYRMAAQAAKASRALGMVPYVTELFEAVTTTLQLLEACEGKARDLELENRRIATELEAARRDLAAERAHNAMLRSGRIKPATVVAQVQRRTRPWTTQR